MEVFLIHILSAYLFVVISIINKNIYKNKHFVIKQINY